MRAAIVTCGIWLAALTPVKAAVPGQSGISAAANTLRGTIVVKKKGIPGWWVKGRCPPGQWKKGRC